MTMPDSRVLIHACLCVRIPLILITVVQTKRYIDYQIVLTGHFCVPAHATLRLGLEHVLPLF